MLLRFFYHLGVRMMTLTWNYPNELGYPNRLASNSSYFPSDEEDDTAHGLTEKGIQFVEEMERLGMIVDVSHLNDAGFWDVIRYTKKPFVASHSNARALVPDCPRDLTDDMIGAWWCCRNQLFSAIFKHSGSESRQKCISEPNLRYDPSYEAYETSRRHPVHRSGI